MKPKIYLVPEHLYDELKAKTVLVDEWATNPLMGIEIIRTPTIYKTTNEQKRTHRKSRINKKWRKRYGFKQVRIDEIFVMPAPGLAVLNFYTTAPMFQHRESFPDPKPPGFCQFDLFDLTED